MLFNQPSKGMLVIKRFASLLVLLLLSSVSIADTLKAESELRPFAEKILQSVAKSDLDAAFSAMKPYVVIPDTEFQSVLLRTKAQREQYTSRYGRSVGYEFLGAKKLGQSLVRLTFIEKTEKTGLPWIFVFYETSEGWVLNSFFWSDQLPQLFNSP